MIRHNRLFCDRHEGLRLPPGRLCRSGEVQPRLIWQGLMRDGNADHSWRGSRAQSGRTPQAGRFAAAGKRARSYETQLEEVAALHSRIPVRSVTVAEGPLFAPPVRRPRSVQHKQFEQGSPGRAGATRPGGQSGQPVPPGGRYGIRGIAPAPGANGSCRNVAPSRRC